MLYASAKNSCTKILKPSFENRLEFMPTNIKCLGKVWTICCGSPESWLIASRSVCQNLNILKCQNYQNFTLAQARQLPLLQAQSSVWNRLSFLNNFLMFLHKFNEIFRVNWWWVADCRASSILKTVPVSQDSKEYAWCKRGEFIHNNTKPLFRITWHFWTNTKYSGEVSLIISVDIYRELT